MEACGLIVEYNPFHNGHLYHVEQAKNISQADCIIAVMSGSFLQRGEPAIIDKYHRTMAALVSGVDIVIELPYPYAVESSHLFAAGSVKTLHEIGAASICFGSESGDVSDFTESYRLFEQQKDIYTKTLKETLNEGQAYPHASKEAYEAIGLSSKAIDLAKPNNILGFSYVQAIMDNRLPIRPLTIKRSKSGYHDQSVTDTIASATSIRQAILAENQLSENVQHALPDASIRQLKAYVDKTNIWHSWEAYFPFLQYRVMTMNPDELREIHGVDEGLEYRIQKTAGQVTSIHEWIHAIKTKRYTWTRIQRTFVHILTNTKKQAIQPIIRTQHIPYVRLLGMTQTGQAYLNQAKHTMDVPLITSRQQYNGNMIHLEDNATHAYHSILSPSVRHDRWRREIEPLIRV